MNKVLAISLWLLALGIHPVEAQRVLSLDSCRAMALRNNKQMSVQRVKQEVAKNIRKAARTKYLPHVSAVGGYVYTSKEVSLLSDDTKDALSNLGTNSVNHLQTGLSTAMPVLSTLFGGAAGVTSLMNGMAGTLNQLGEGIIDAFHTDTRHMFGGSIMVTQPVFMGGAIIAMNKMADLGEELAANSADARRQETLYQIDQAYWQVVSLHHKQKLAEGYLNLVKKLDDDVQKMIREGVATRSEGLSVSVKVNEAEMAVMKVNDGLTLSKMLLCQLCGLPVDEQVTLEEVLSPLEGDGYKAGVYEAPTNDYSNRPELKMLQNVVDINHQATNLLKAGHLPQVLLMGGYTATNPNVYNGFQRKLGGAWNVAVMMRIPIWNWGDVAYKVRAAKGATTIAALELEEAREKMELQVNQSNFRVNEANKKLELALTSQQRAEENLRTANLGFQEGVISSTTVMEAQTAWLQAQSQRIDAEIDVQLSRVNLQKSLGILR
jgi:outer membrane protein TolC